MNSRNFTRAAPPRSPALAKWGGAVTHGENGFQIVPNLLLRKQAELGLNATDLLVLLNITMHWWGPDDFPFPRPSVIAQRMGVSARTVERSITKLRSKELLDRLPRMRRDGPSVRPFDMRGLVERLERIAERIKPSSAETAQTW